MSHLDYFSADTVETWNTNSSTCDTPLVTIIPFPCQITVFQSPTNYFPYVSDFLLKTLLNKAKKSFEHINMLPEDSDEASLANIKMERQRLPEGPLKSWARGFCSLLC